MSGQNTLKFNIQGMSCAACAAKVEDATRTVERVVDCSVNLLTNSMEVVLYQRNENNDEVLETVSSAICLAVAHAGYKAIEVDPDSDRETKIQRINDAHQREIKSHIIRMVSSAILLSVLMYISMGREMLALPLLPVLEANPMINGMLQAILSIGVMVINYRFFINGTKGFIHLSPNMDSLVMLGSLVSFGMSVYMMVSMRTDRELYFDSAAMILTLITVGKLLEAISKSRTGNALEELMALSPKMANVVRDGVEITIPANQVIVGDTVKVYIGEMVPADGVITEGESSLDESALTGESRLAKKKVGDNVFSATNNYTGNFTMKVTAVGEDTSFGKVINIVEEASASKASINRLADRIAKYFVPIVLIIAAFTFAIWIFIGADITDAITYAVSVLVISCPSALGLATPVAIMVGNGTAARHKILFKSAEIMEVIGKTRTVVFDKTGTITEGIPKGLAVAEYDKVQDKIKQDSPFTIHQLKKMGINTVLLSGDRNAVATGIAEEVGIGKVISDVLPDGKSSHVESIMAIDSNRPVMMVGDGINDAPALTVADVGVAIGNGTDVAIDSADVVLQSDSVIDVVNAILVGRKTLHIIKLNLFWAFIYNIVAIPVAAGALSSVGLELTPGLCALLMSFSSFCVVINALRLNRIRLFKHGSKIESDEISPLEAECVALIENGIMNRNAEIDNNTL